MKIEKAIEILEVHHRAAFCQLHKDIAEATKLGIEALNRIRASRQPEHLYSSYLLPGETEG